MQALMLAAGMGKRLGKYTQNGTKCMVSINGQTLIEYAIEALIHAGIKKFILVVGYRAEVLQTFLAGKFPQIEIQYILNPIYDKTNNIYSLFLAAEELCKDDTILLESDLIFDKKIISELIKEKDPNLAVVSKFESWMDGTVTLLDEYRNILGLIDKKSFKWEDIEQYYKTVNIYKFSKEFSTKQYMPFLKAYQQAFGENEYYEQALKVLAFLDETQLKAYPVSAERWYEIDDVQDLTIAENRFASGSKKLALTQDRYGGYWRFPQLLDYCYLVNPYFPNHQLIKELQTSFSPLLTQYPSGAAQQSLLAAKMFNLEPSQIVVGNGAAELIAALSPMLDDNILIPYPTFNEYPERFEKHNKKIFKIKTKKNDFHYGEDDIINKIISLKEEGVTIKTLLLINPDNPSGNFLSEKSIKKLLDFLKAENIVLVFDESFIDFADSKKRYTLLGEKWLIEYPNLIVIKSISKSYGVPGLRLGVLASSNTEMNKKIQKEISIWNINSFAEYFLQIFEKYKKSYSEACDKIAFERHRFSTELNKLSDLTVFDSQANYLLCQLSDNISATKLAEKLLEHHNIFIKDLSTKQGFQHGQFIRLAIRDAMDNEKLIGALKKYL